MSEYPDWFAEHVRRKALAELRIAKEINKQTTKKNENDGAFDPSTSQIHERFQHAQDLSKPSFGMMFLSVMLTLTSIVLVSLCFITTVDSYDMALTDTDSMGRPPVVDIIQNGGPLNGAPVNRFIARPSFHAFHFQKPRMGRPFRFKG